MSTPEHHVQSSPHSPHFHVPQPCSASWDDMSPTATGRFCAQCHKEVIDLTARSPSEIEQVLEPAIERAQEDAQQQPIGVCVRMRRSHTPPPSPFKRRVLTAGIAAMLAASGCQSTNDTEEITTQIPTVEKSHSERTDSEHTHADDSFIIGQSAYVTGDICIGTPAPLLVTPPAEPPKEITEEIESSPLRDG